MFAKAGREREFVRRDEKLKRIGGEDDESPPVDWLSKNDDADGEGSAEWKLVENYLDIVLNKELPARQPVVPDDELLHPSVISLPLFPLVFPDET